ncbi:MAG: hypothetical protein Kow0032_14440 [Methyloligellaceae bacterium]
MNAKRFGAVLVIVIPVGLAGCWPGGDDVRHEKHFTLQARAKEPLVLKLPGLPKKGFSWRLNESESTGLERVRVEQIGWSYDPAPRGSGSYTRPAVLRVAVAPRQPGAVHLVFEYVRNTAGAAPSARWSWDIDIAPR